MASGGSVVNLLDMREDEEEADKQAAGNRWARKAKGAKGGRNRRQRNKGDDADGKRASGFGRYRTNSNMSMGSDYSDAGEDEMEDNQTKQSQHSSSQPKPASSQSKPPPRLPDKQELLPGDADAQRSNMAPLEVEKQLSGTNDVFQAARQIAQLRQLIRGQASGQQGKEYSRNVWEYYMVKAGWSDPLCVALNHSSMYLACFVPFAWPFRLCQTVKRAAPVTCKVCRCMSCPIGGFLGVPMILFLFLLPFVAGATFLTQVRTPLQEQLQTISPDLAQNMTLVSIVLTILAVLYLLWGWARILQSVGAKYAIKEAMNKPNSFVAKAMCCICATNMRAAVHVDRAQGFLKVLKADRTLIELSDQLDTLSPPPQGHMV